MVSGPGFPPADQPQQTNPPPSQNPAPAATPSPAPSAISKLTWIVFGAGLLLAISGGIALAVAFLRG
jgi:hypothetical protein